MRPKYNLHAQLILDLIRQAHPNTVSIPDLLKNIPINNSGSMKDWHDAVRYQLNNLALQRQVEKVKIGTRCYYRLGANGKKRKKVTSNNKQGAMNNEQK